MVAIWIDQRDGVAVPVDAGGGGDDRAEAHGRIGHDLDVGLVVIALRTLVSMRPGDVAVEHAIGTESVDEARHIAGDLLWIGSGFGGEVPRQIQHRGVTIEPVPDQRSGRIEDNGQVPAIDQDRFVTHLDQTDV